jgi:hypothetical protein
MPKTLLEKAKDHRSTKGLRRLIVGRATQEEEELALAWLGGEITFTQACAALGVQGSSMLGVMAVALRRAHQKGRLKVVN